MLTATEITTDHQSYGERRADERARVMPIRAERRIRIGDMLVFEFENLETLHYQVQEMVFVERITDPADVVHEIELYGRMAPNSHELCATMFVELDQDADVRAELARLVGIQGAVSLQIGAPGAGSDGQPWIVGATELRGPDEGSDRPSDTVSVHVVRFTLADDQRDAFRDPQVPVELVVDHPEYAESTPITGATRLSLLADLALGGLSG
ncbi:MAG TPA: DUF3501 family protein [Frankiaceae bacterium]|jgi:hypothetical protein|nr:DUF3501 family protein [Frankiaceae bacterium]